MRQVKDTLQLIQAIYTLIGKELPDPDSFVLNGITLVIDGPQIEITERGLPVVKGSVSAVKQGE